MLKIDFVFLLKAIKENQNISISLKKKNKSSGLLFFSRFLHVQSQTKIKPKTIIIDLPYVDDFTHKQLESGDKISVEFHETGYRFCFETIVLDPIQLNSSIGASVPALQIEWPPEIIDGNRRSVYRAAVSLESFPKISYFILERANKIKDEKFAEFKGIEALMIDISETGAAVKIKRTTNIHNGDRIKLIFLLDENEQFETELEGRVQNVRHFPENDTDIYGIQFDPDYVDHYKKVLSDIACYVMALDHENVSFLSINQIVSNNPYVQRFINRDIDEDLLNMLLEQKLPLSKIEYLESLVYVIDDKLYYPKVKPILDEIPLLLKEAYVQRQDANYKVVYYLLEEAIKNSDYKIIAGIIKNPYLPVDFMSHIAMNGTPRMLRSLLVNKIRLIAYPKIMDLIEENSNTTTSIKEKVTILKNQGNEIKAISKISEKDIIDHLAVTSSEEWGFAKESGNKKRNKVSWKTIIKERVLDILHSINAMTLSERVKLALSGTKAERLILSKDSNKMTHFALIESPEITENEIIKLVENENVHREVIHEICHNKKWTDKYFIVFALLKNYKILRSRAFDFILRLNSADLKTLANDKTIHPEVYALANNKYLHEK